MADNIDELKEIVAQSLEAKGVLAKLRVRRACSPTARRFVIRTLHHMIDVFLICAAVMQAQIRKHVFDVIEENSPGSKSDSAENDKLALIRTTPTDVLALDLVREFLDYYELDYTTSVFHAEARVV
jgi:hypothetical protein